MNSSNYFLVILFIISTTALVLAIVAFTKKKNEGYRENLTPSSTNFDQELLEEDGAIAFGWPTRWPRPCPKSQCFAGYSRETGAIVCVDENKSCGTPPDGSG